MADLPSSLKPIADKLRGLSASLGMTVYTVTLRIRQFDSQTFTDGYTDTLIPLLTDGQPAPVKRLSQKDVVLSGGLYQEADLRVTLTPEFENGGYDLAALDPPPGANPAQFTFIVRGSGLPAEGALFKRIGVHVSPVTLELILRNTGKRP